ncbi:MAG: hypothetical protein H0V66_05265 [Bdellovibrionales bacterium]|nr:hypothetical protein [Bdellovibrionales bacterium]
MKILFLFLILITNFARAEKEIEYKFRPDYWSKGFHLNAGGGLNVTQFYSDDRFNDIGYGLNFKTDLGYFLTNRFAVEWSSNVKFDRLEKYLIWDTLITFGIRYRIKEFYVRGFYGRAPTVVFLSGRESDEYEDAKASRLQFDGPVYGLAVGKTLQNRNGLIWFIELSGTFQRLKSREAIHMDGEVPEVVAREEDKSSVISLYAMIGVMVF